MNTNSLLTEVLQLAMHSPSIHNTQMWQFGISSNQLSIHLNKKYLVPIADPEYRDTWVSLGIQVDIIQNLFKEYGVTTDINLLQKNLKVDHSQPVLLIHFDESKLKKPSQSRYIDLLKKRRSYRGPFKSSSMALNLDITNTFIINDSMDLKSINKAYHLCAAKQSLNSGYMDELRQWVKLSKDEQGFGTEGLDYLSLNLNSIDTFLAKLFLNDKWAKRFSRVGMHGLLTDESKNFKNMSGIIIKVLDKNELFPSQLIKEGRSYISIWLSLVEQGFEACPISTLIDLPEGHELLRRLLKLPDNALFSMALRFGEGDGSQVRRVRRSFNDWLVS